MISLPPQQRILQAIDCVSIGACNDHEVGVLPRIDSSAYLLRHLFHGDNLLALHMAALLRPDLVLDMQSSNTSAFILVYSSSHIDWIAVAGICICDQWQIA